LFTTLAETFDWGKEFKPFTLYHLLMAGSGVVIMMGSWWIGRNWRGTPKEDRFRKGWGWTVVVYKILETVWYNWPSNFDIQESLPLQLCDLAAFVAAVAMITQRRTWRAVLYFWAIGLSTQAFFTPILRMGYQSWNFWFFWISHTMIIGSAMYDIVVRRFRPGVRDLVLGLAWSVAFTIMVMIVNAIWHTNYGYVGNTRPLNPTIIDKLGSWPLRVFKLAGVVVVLFVILWGVWPLSRRLGLWREQPEPGVCPKCGYDRKGMLSETPCPECGAKSAAVS